jgi:hypothetical protein
MSESMEDSIAPVISIDRAKGLRRPVVHPSLAPREEEIDVKGKVVMDMTAQLLENAIDPNPSVRIRAQGWLDRIARAAGRNPWDVS